MKNIGKFIANFAFVVFVVVVLVLNASFGLQFVGRLFPDSPIIQFSSLFLFDGGALIWFLLFLFAAEGTSQRSIAIIGTVADLLGAFAIAATEIFTAGEGLLLDPGNAAWLRNTAMYVLIGWVIINAILIYLFHATAPAVMAAISTRNRTDKIMEQASKITDNRIEQLSLNVADQMSKAATAKALMELEQSTGISLLGDGAREVIQAQYIPDPPSEEKESLIDRLFGKKKPKATYHDAPRQDDGNRAPRKRVGQQWTSRGYRRSYAVNAEAPTARTVEAHVGTDTEDSTEPEDILQENPQVRKPADFTRPRKRG